MMENNFIKSSVVTILFALIVVPSIVQTQRIEKKNIRSYMGFLASDAMLCKDAEAERYMN